MGRLKPWCHSYFSRTEVIDGVLSSPCARLNRQQPGVREGVALGEGVDGVEAQLGDEGEPGLTGDRADDRVLGGRCEVVALTIPLRRHRRRHRRKSHHRLRSRHRLRNRRHRRNRYRRYRRKSPAA